MIREKRSTLRLTKKAKQPDNPLHETLMRQHDLSRHESSLVLAAIKTPEKPIESLKSLPPGIRELRMRNHISSLWDGPPASLSGMGREEYLCSRYCHVKGIVERVKGAEDAYRNLQIRFGLEQPSEKDRLTALSEPGELSLPQLMFLRDFQMVQEQVRIPADELSAVMAWLEGLPQDRMAWSWLREGYCVSALAALVHKLRFTDEELTVKEEELLHRAFDGKPVSESVKLMREKFSMHTSFYISGPFSVIRSMVWNQVRNPLLADIGAIHELCVLLDMLDIHHEKPSVRIDYERGISNGHFNHRLLSMANQDSFTSFELDYQGKRMLIDAVFDGVGGYSGGRAASNIARETLEAAALAGWVAGPEDIRRALVLADIIIKLEKADPEFENMCTTAAVSMISGDEFYGIHCGDSDWNMVRGNIVLSSQRQGNGRFIFASIGITPDILVNNSAKDYIPMKLKDGDGIFTVTDGIGDVICGHEYAMLLSYKDREEKVLADLRLLAESRHDPCAEYQPLCGCEPVIGKNDDRSALFRLVRLPDDK